MDYMPFVTRADWTSSCLKALYLALGRKFEAERPKGVKGGDGFDLERAPEHDGLVSHTDSNIAGLVFALPS